MITISCYGLDQYIVGNYSEENTKNIAALFETKEENVVFVASDEYIFFKGVEQTTYQALIKVDAPEKFESLEDVVAQYLLKTFAEYSIHVRVVFEYFHAHHEHEYVNKEYPRFMKEDNVVNVEESEDEDELYEGNIFEGMEKKLEEAYKNQTGCCDDECECDCDGECDCDDECECGEHECHCDHHHN